MSDLGTNKSSFGIDQQGLASTGDQYWNLGTASLYEQAVLRHEGLIAKDGPFVTTTGERTGRSANDKFIVENAASKDSRCEKTNLSKLIERVVNLARCALRFIGRIATPP